MRYVDVDLTPEQEAELRRCLPLTPTGDFSYVPKAYRSLPAQLQPVFRLRPLTGPERVRLEDTLRGAVEYDEAGKVRRVMVRRGDFVLRVCEGHIVGWEGWRLPDGREIPYDSTLSCVPSELLYEIADVLLSKESGELSEAERLGFSS